MKYFPWITEQFFSPLMPAEVAEQLTSQTGPPLTWHSIFESRPNTFFRGQVGGEHFAVFRNIRGRNSMLPVIEGWVELAEIRPGSVVRIRHRLHVATLVVAACWLSFAGIMFMNVAVGWFNGNGFQPLEMLAAAPFVLGLIFFIYPFWLEVSKSRPYLMKLLILTPLKGKQT